jgi:hypothetical protein
LPRRTSAAQSGARSRPARAALEPHSGDHDKRLQFDKGFEVVNDFRRDECTMWRQIYEGQ